MPTYDHRALRRAPQTYALGAWLAIGLGLAACVGVALDACDVDAQAETVHGFVAWGDGVGPRRVAITESDLLWGARMLLGSQQGGAVAGGNVATDARLWAAAQRHALQCDRDSREGRACRWRRFSDSFRAYSTAIAPQWSVRGWCAPGDPRAATAMCSAARLRRRAWVSSRTWEHVADCCADLRGYLQTFARGERPNPVPRACNTDQLSTMPRGAVVPPGSSNWYACDRESCRWPERYVRIEAP